MRSALVCGVCAAATMLAFGCDSGTKMTGQGESGGGGEHVARVPPPSRISPRPAFGPEGPWPIDDVTLYGPSNGIPGVVTGVGVDDGQNVYAIDGSAAYAMPVGATGFTRTDSGGQFDRGYPVYSIVGGDHGKVYLGFLAWEAAPEELSEDDKLFGDVDRMVLLPDGTLDLEFHYRINSSTAKWMDHTRSIFSMARVVGGPNHGDVYLGSNHGATLIRGDEYADHRHALFIDSTGSQAIGYVWAVNTDVHGNLLYAGHWKVAALPPSPMDTVMSFIDYDRVKWKVDTYPQHLGSIEEPKNLHAVAGDLEAGMVYVGSWGMGLSAMQGTPRKWWSIPGTPDTVINSLELDPIDGKLWVATGSSGLWRWDPPSGRWEQSPFVPGHLQVNQIYLDTTVTPRALYAATNGGLYVLRVE